MAKEKILVVDDEEDIIELVRFNLSKDGYRIDSSLTGEDALKKVRSDTFDLIILDLMLPGIDGLEVTRKLRDNPKTRSVPIVMLTAKGEEPDIVAGLELGADDYITKPFSPRILIARVRAVLRRKTTEPIDQKTVIRIYDFEINSGTRGVTVGGRPIELTYTDFKVLFNLARLPGWVITRTQIVDAVRGEDYPVTDRSVDVQIVGLRKKLGDHGKYIETVRGVGYRFRESL